MINMQLLERIESILDTQFEKDLFHASIENITHSDSPIRFNNFAYAVRELTRHVLSRLAPDDEVLKCKWYTNETETDKGISRKQRIYFAIHGGLLPSYVQEILGLDVQSFFKNFREIIDRLSKYTHIEIETFGLDEAKMYLYVNQTLETLVELFGYIAETKEILSEALRENIETALIDSILEQTFDSIDILATHHSLDYVSTENLNLLDIDHKFIYFEAIGTIDYEMQWGSYHDVKVGDGVIFHQSFPFKCGINSNVLNPKEIEVNIDSIEIETK
jgi:hypothetical protein